MITAYVKPTNFCNVGCTHCYLPEVVRADRNRMSLNTLRAAAELVRDMARARRAAGALILWHGGEPLTVPVGWYEAAGELLDEVLPGHAQAMQTSLIPLRAEHLPFVKARMGGHLGSSLDFSQRQLNGSVEAYHALWMQKVELARDSGVDITPGVVPTTRELGREADLVAWFVARGFPRFNIDRYNAYALHFPDRPTNLQHSQFLIGLFDALMAEMDRRGRAPLVNVAAAAATGVLYGQGGDRWGTTCQSDFVVVEPDGGLNTCTDKATVEPAYSYAAEGWEAFARSSFRRKWVRVNGLTHKQPHCQSCENQSWCQSGCPITPNGLPEGEVECSGYKTYLTHLRRFVAAGGRPVLEAYLAQAAPADIASPYGAIDRAVTLEAAA